MTEDLQKQKRLLEDRLGFVKDMKETVEGKGDVVEIREDYDAEKEAKWRGLCELSRTVQILINFITVKTYIKRSDKKTKHDITNNFT